MRHIFLLLLLINTGGCSGVISSTYYEVIDNSALDRAHVYDWYESETTGPSAGYYRPPIYSYNYNTDYYLIYPILVQQNGGAIGPPVLPIFPIGATDSTKDEYNLFRIRYYAKQGNGLNPPKSLKVIHDKDNIISYKLKQKSKDKVGTIYTCFVNELPKDMRMFEIEISLYDGHSVLLKMEKKESNMYSPLMSFNGPSPRPWIEVE